MGLLTALRKDSRKSRTVALRSQAERIRVSLNCSIQVVRVPLIWSVFTSRRIAARNFSTKALMPDDENQLPKPQSTKTSKVNYAGPGILFTQWLSLENADRGVREAFCSS